jgi:hypothetical protein
MSQSRAATSLSYDWQQAAEAVHFKAGLTGFNSAK